MSDKLPKKIKLPKALRKLGIEAMVETPEGRKILADALLAAASAAAAVLTQDRAGNGASVDKADGRSPKRAAAIAVPARRRVGRPRSTVPPKIASEKPAASAPPSRIVTSSSNSQNAGAPVPRGRRPATAKAAAPSTATKDGVPAKRSRSKSNDTAPRTPGRRGRPPRQKPEGNEPPKA